MANTNTIPSVLAFEKKLVPSDGYFFGTNWDNKDEFSPLALQERAVRGTISSRKKAAIINDPAKLDAKVENANPQTVDSCALAMDQDTIKHYFTLKVLGGIETPSACNNANFKASYQQAAKAYIEKEGFNELARRYAINIANARFLWRNRVGAEKIEVKVTVLNKDNSTKWTFDATNYSTRHFDYDDSEIKELAGAIAEALSASDGCLVLEIITHAKVGNAQSVYPSQELIMDKGKGKKSKVLYQVNGTAAMHSQKIGNALRSIDTWYPAFGDESATAGPIAIEPYGSVTNLGTAYRPPKEKQDFYSHFDKWARGETLKNINDEHFVMAVLVRGGVFSK